MDQIARVEADINEDESEGRPYAQLIGGERIGRQLLGSIVRIDDLCLNPENVRTHNARNLDAIKRSLTKFGQQQAIIYDVTSGAVLVGNGRLESMKQIGWSLCAAMPFEGTVDEARAYAIADNRTSELGEWDWEGLAGQLGNILEGGEFVGEDMGFAPHDLEPLLNANWRPQGSEDLDNFQNGDANGGANSEGQNAPGHSIAFSPDLYLIVSRAVGSIREADGVAYDESNAIAEICRRYTNKIE